MPNYAIRQKQGKANTADYTPPPQTPADGSSIELTSGRTASESLYSHPDNPSDLPVIITGKPVIGNPDGVMQTCPKYHNCNAPICPLDEDWTSRLHLNGEAACRYLREWAKIQSGMATKAAFECDLPEQAQNLIAEAYPEILDRHGSIKTAMEKAARTPSKMIKGRFGNLREESQ